MAISMPLVEPLILIVPAIIVGGHHYFGFFLYMAHTSSTLASSSASTAAIEDGFDSQAFCMALALPSLIVTRLQKTNAVSHQRRNS